MTLKDHIRTAFVRQFPDHPSEWIDAAVVFVVGLGTPDEQADLAEEISPDDSERCIHYFEEMIKTGGFKK